MKVWVVTYDDGDFYCEGEHLVAVCSSEEKANEAIEKDKNGHYFKYRPHTEYNTFEAEIDDYLV